MLLISMLTRNRFSSLTVRLYFYTQAKTKAKWFTAARKINKRYKPSLLWDNLSLFYSEKQAHFRRILWNYEIVNIIESAKFVSFAVIHLTSIKWIIFKCKYIRPFDCPHKIVAAYEYSADRIIYFSNIVIIIFLGLHDIKFV